MSFSPGPWRWEWIGVYGPHGTDTNILRDSASNEILHAADETWGGNEADARLIAAAPEMYELLRANFGPKCADFEPDCIDCQVFALLAEIDGQEPAG